MFHKNYIIQVSLIQKKIYLILKSISGVFVYGPNGK